MIKTRAKAVAVAAAIAGLALAGAQPAHADPPPPPPPAAADALMECEVWVGQDWNPVWACYDRKYDNFWVYDGEPDGYSAVVRWSTQAGESGSCRNADGAGTWKRCSYDLREYRSNGTRNHVTWTDFRYDAETDYFQLIGYGGTSVT